VRPATRQSLRGALVMAVHAAPNHVEKTFAAGNIEAVVLRIKKYIIGVPGDFHLGHGPAAGRVQYQQSRRRAAADKEPVIRFIKAIGKLE
jgi:hypothetical protein